MFSVTNQRPSDEMLPLPVPAKDASQLIDLAKRVLAIVIISGFAASFGAAIALETGRFSLLSAGLFWGALGAVLAVACRRWVPIPSVMGEYRIQTLEQMSHTTANPKALEAIARLQHFFQKPFHQFPYFWHVHDLHTELARVTDHIDAEKVGADKVWRAFLCHLDKLPLAIDRRGSPYTFSTKKQCQRLAAGPFICQTGWLSSWSLRYASDLAAITKLSQLCFDKEGIASEKDLRGSLSGQGGCIVSRHPKTQEVLGYCWFYPKSSAIRIGELARCPEAARLGIGSALLEEVIKAHPQKDIEIWIHQSHPFVSTLKQKGFKEKKLLEEKVFLRLTSGQ